MKKTILPSILFVLLIAALLFAFVACNDDEAKEATDALTTPTKQTTSDNSQKSESSQGRPEGTLELKVTTNIPDACTVSGSGYYKSGADIHATAQVKDGYRFLGWYVNDTDCVSSSLVYNGKMWDKDVEFSAKVIIVPKGATSSSSSSSSQQGTYQLIVKSFNENYGLVSLDDQTNSVSYEKDFREGQSFKVLAYSKSSERFLGWYGSSGELITTNATFTMSMPSFDYRLIAAWGDKSALESALEDVKYSYELIDQKSEYKIVGYSGNNTSLILPSSHEGLPVTCIGDSAFKNYTGLKSVTIPDSVTSIGNYAFSGCTGLTSVTVADGNTVYHSAGNCLINTATKTLIAGCNNSVIPTDGSVTSIRDSAFSGCTGLTSVTIPNSVTSIGYYAFSDCSSLTSVTIGNGVTSIGYHAFSGCTGLKSVTIPDSLTSMDNGAFYGCDNLTYNIYDNAKYLGNATNPYVVLIKAASKDITSCTIHPDTKLIYSYAFSDCSKLTSITIPNSVTSINYEVFEGCTGLTSVTIPNSVTSIGWGAFYNCSDLTNITYQGTKAQWNAISKDSYWNYNTGTYTIHCTDGDIAKS